MNMMCVIHPERVGHTHDDEQECGLQSPRERKVLIVAVRD
jgi:hypothetical protein